MIDTISLRALEPEDVDLMYQCDNDEEARIWTDYSAPLSRAQLMDYALNYDADPFKAGQLRLIAEKEQDEGGKVPVGIVDLYNISQKDGKAYIGIYVLPEFRRQGTGSNILKVTEEYANRFLGLRMLVAKVSTQNGIAISLFKKAEYSQLAILPGWHRLGPAYHDIILFTRILNSNS